MYYLWSFIVNWKEPHVPQVWLYHHATSSVVNLHIKGIKKNTHYIRLQLSLFTLNKEFIFWHKWVSVMCHNFIFLNKSLIKRAVLLSNYKQSFWYKDPEALVLKYPSLIKFQMTLHPWNEYLENISGAHSHIVKEGIFVAAHLG